MIIYSDILTTDQLKAVASDLDLNLYGLDTWMGQRRRRIHLTGLRPLTERYRLIRQDFQGRTRPVWAVCWHGHFAFIDAIMTLDPNAEVKSLVAHWRGLQDFRQRAPQSKYRQIGSQVQPLLYGEACRCTDDPSQPHTEHNFDLVGAM